MTNPVWVNAIGLVYRDSRPEKGNTKSWNQQVDEAVAILSNALGSAFDESEFRSRTMMPKRDQ